MGDEHRDDVSGRARADVYASARIGAAAALTLVLVVLLVLDVGVPDYHVSPGVLLPLLGAICALLGPSATAYIDRDGTIVRAIDPAKYAAWSQGDVAHPNTKLPTIAAAVASGMKNEWVYESIECSGAGTEPYTDAQFESVAQLVAAASKALGIPVNRSTVVVHADINSVSRRSDPWPPATREARVKRVIARANTILRPPITTATVKAGDTLSGIASANGLTLAALLAFPENAKDRANPGLIHSGDVVRVK